MIYEFHDGNFQFFTAVQERGRVVIFRVRVDQWPEKRAAEKQIPFAYVRSSSKYEIWHWIKTHQPDFPMLGAHLENAEWEEVDESNP